MGLKANICQVCGGTLKNCGTYYKCVCCDTEFRIDDSMTKAEVEAYFDRLNAFADAERNLQLDCPRFDEAESEFGLIVQKHPDWSAGYWGLVRAKFGIKFEQDLSGKAVPSCYKSTYEDFRDTDEYKKAVALAETPELRQSYEKIAEYIARVVKEWREEAQKYDYDVFISFKASNDLDGSETRDAREMHKLYDLLKDKGYHVFFSPVTLITDGVGGKGSEPYIFNALDKAKALIVYGSRKEYFSSTWVQNEWQRYLRAIKAGRKEKDSLLVLYEGFNPKELPQGLRRIQGIEYGISAYPAVLFALERVFRNKEEAARDREQELRRAEEKKHKAEQENAQKMQDMMTQLVAMQAELTRLKSKPSAVSQPFSVTNTFALAAGKKNGSPQQKTTVGKVTNPIAAKTSLPKSAAVSKKTVVDPFHGQNKEDFDIEMGVLKKYKGLRDKGHRRKVIIPDGVTRIGDSAFEECNKLTSIVIPEGVTEIGEFAFNGCSVMANIIISSSVMSIRESAFSGCCGITHITVNKENKKYHCAGDCLIETESKILIRGYKSSIIPVDDSVIKIGDYAFDACGELKKIVIPEGVTEIGTFAFKDCEGLTRITIPSSVIRIGKFAISGCNSLAHLSVNKKNKKYHSSEDCIIETASKTLLCGCKNSIIPTDGSVASIAAYAFENCGGLTSIAIPSSITNIEKCTFSGCCGLMNIAIPDSVISIGESAFSGCKKLTNILIPDSVNSIGASAFNGCSGLRSITIPNGVTCIEDGVFRDCSGLRSITIPDGVTSIGKNAFHGCAWLTGIVIPTGVTSIGESAFERCWSLTNVTLPNGLTSIEWGTFYDCSELTSITIPNSVTSIGNYAFSGCSELTSITIPNSVTNIGTKAFYNCKSLKKFVVPKIKGYNGFMNKALPNSLEKIGESAFEGCSRLKKIIIPKAAEISRKAFDFGVKIIRK